MHNNVSLIGIYQKINEDKSIQKKILLHETPYLN
jgi:hypothetical protein